MRRLFARIHLWLSVPLGLILTIVSLTGALLVFEPEITRALDPHLYRVTPPAGGRALTPSQLAARLGGQLPDSLRIASLQMAADPTATWRITFSEPGRGSWSVDPYTGRLLGEVKRPALFRQVRSLHRWLLDAPASRNGSSTGRRVVGTASLLLVPILVSGLVIWIPRSRKALSHRLRITARYGRPRLWYDCHVALGFYAAAALLVMALTGPTWSFEWYRKAAFGLFGGNRTTARVDAASGTGGRAGGGGRAGTAANAPLRDEAADPEVWDLVAEELRRHWPAARSITLEHTAATIVRGGGHVRRSDTVTFDPADGRLQKIVRFEELPPARRLRLWFYALHTGTWGGLFTRILYLLAALVGASLPLTGYYLWLRKRFRATRRPL